MSWRLDFACPKIRNFANILSEMKKILNFTLIFGLCMGGANAAIRDGNTVARQNSAGSTQQRISTTVKTERAARTALVPNAQNVTQRGATQTTTSRAATTTAARSAIQTAAQRGTVQTSTSTRSARAANAPSQRTATPTVAARAATTTSTTQTRTGTEYEQCKSAYFACMDQFCQLKSDDYRRCSCNDRVLELAKTREAIKQAGEQLTVFTENLDVVGMTAAQAEAMRTASEGENALTSDTSTSKALLQAIMNSIRGGDTSVSGKFSGLNSINLAFDTTSIFGASDSGQTLATYNGQSLYTAVYPQCRDAVKSDCNDASLQRAVTAYLMAIEQDCNTVQTALAEKQKQMKSAIREGSAMLDLARVENRKNHNSDNIAQCINNVESAILSEEVCGAGYHKCLDNGQYIDVDTGAPIAGIVKFYELENLLKFADGVDAADQKLSQNPNNRIFVQNFENRVKKFAQPALDKCTEQSDIVWTEYLDRAMLDIFYAQKAKVAEIKQGCFDFVSMCYMNGEKALTDAMKELTGNNGIVLQPNKITLEAQMCKDYVESCDNMFEGNIIADYIQERQQTDTVAACYAVAKQCFDKFGGTGYQNFYYPHSGLFTKGQAADWFTLYKYSNNGQTKEYVSQCAKQLTQIDACNNDEIIEQAFGGFDKMKTIPGTSTNTLVYYYDEDGKEERYGLLNPNDTGKKQLRHRLLRSSGAATEVYNQIVDTLTVQCLNLQGRFVEIQSVRDNAYDLTTDLCISNFEQSQEYSNKLQNLMTIYGITKNENMCPRDYSLGVDTLSWGACLCWENGGRRSKDGHSAMCVATLPTLAPPQNKECPDSIDYKNLNGHQPDNWCTQKLLLSTDNRVCPIGGRLSDKGECTTMIKDALGNDVPTLLEQLPEAITK